MKDVNEPVALHVSVKNVIGLLLIMIVFLMAVLLTLSHARELPAHEMTADPNDFKLRASMQSDDYESFSIHLAEGADPTEWLDDSQFGWVLCAATEAGRERYLALLIDKGFDVNYRQVNISTAISLPLTCAVRFANLTALEMLVAAGADPSFYPCNSCANRPAMSVMSEAIIVGKYDLALWLFDKGNYSDEQLRSDVGMLERHPVNESSPVNAYRLELVEKLREKGYEVTPWTRQ